VVPNLEEWSYFNYASTCNMRTSIPFVLHYFNPLKDELNPICYLLTLLELTIFSTLAG